MLNMYEIYLNATNYPIFNMQDFQYWLCASIMDCFGQLVSPLCGPPSPITWPAQQMDNAVPTY